MFLKIYKTSQKDQLAYASYSLANDPKRYNIMRLTF